MWLEHRIRFLVALAFIAFGKGYRLHVVQWLLTKKIKRKGNAGKQKTFFFFFSSLLKKNQQQKTRQFQSPLRIFSWRTIDKRRAGQSWWQPFSAPFIFQVSNNGLLIVWTTQGQLRSLLCWTEWYWKRLLLHNGLILVILRRIARSGYVIILQIFD